MDDTAFKIRFREKKGKVSPNREVESSVSKARKKDMEARTDDDSNAIDACARLLGRASFIASFPRLSQTVRLTEEGRLAKAREVPSYAI